MNTALAGVVAYLALGVLGFLFRPRWLSSALAILAGAVSLALWAPGFSEMTLGPSSWGIAVVGDELARGFWALALFLHVAVAWHERARLGAFQPLLTLLTGTALAAVISIDLFNLYVAMELAALLSFLLISYEAKTKAVWATLQYLLLAAVGMILYLLGVGLVYGKLGTLSLSQIRALAPGLSDPTVAIGVGLLVAGASVKSGLFLFGLWLPPAHGYAPTGVSAVLSGLVVKLGVVALARLAVAFPLGDVLLALGVVTGFGGIIYALWERDLKVFLAFSTVSQLGYILIGFGIGGGAAQGAILYAVAHGLFKALLFLAAGQAIEEASERHIAKLKGKLAWPSALGLAVGTWAIVGLPPLAGFAGKETLSLAVPAPVGWILTALSFGTAAAFAKLLPLFWPGQGRGKIGGLALLACGVIGLGLLGVVSLPGLVSLTAWGKALLVAAMGYLFYFVFRRFQPALPRPSLDRAITTALVSSLGLIAGFLFTR